jgi:ABC-type dipeptide/oligopeptide/nickel transport system ATPase component/ABC-type dipeptide/oligopeptide/nickel transport system permease subunit
MRRVLGALGRDRRAVAGALLLAGFAVMAVVGPWLVGDAGAIVDRPLLPPSWAHPLGTSGEGQEVLWQTIVGARLTLGIGLAVGLLCTAIGALVGIGAGYAGGLVDDVAAVATNVFLVIPGLPLAIVLAAYLPPGPVRLTVVLVFAGWAWCARVFRAETLSLRQREFIAAARLAGESHLRILVGELLPNMASIVASAFVGTTIYAIGAEVGLEFLGLGDLGAVTWGTNLYWASNDSALLTGAWWTFLPTGLCVALVGCALTLVNFALDAVTNPRLRERRRRPGARPAATATATTSAAPLLSLRGFGVSYGGAPVVDEVSFDLEAGEVFGLVGESGSGKSTVAHAILRLLPAHAELRGKIRFAGADVLALDEAALRALRWRQAAIVLQSAMSALNPVLTVGDQFVDTLLARRGEGDRREARRRAVTQLALVGLDDRVLSAHPHQLSGGMRQRVGLALALLLQPRLLILDEPTTALDVVVQRELLERLIALQRQLGFAILFISHDLPLVMSLATRIGVLRDGKLVELADTERLRTAPRHPYTRQLLSSFPSLPPRRAPLGATP